MSTDPPAILRDEWSFALASASQRFAGAILELDSTTLTRAVAALARSLPLPSSQVESLVLRDRLRIATYEAGRQFHAQFHRCIDRRCHQRGVPIQRAVRWDDVERSAEEVLADWASGYQAEFNLTHEWPRAIRAAEIIRDSLSSPLDVESLARAVGSARSPLIRSFKDTYGVSMSAYQARGRIETAFTMLRDSESNVGCVAFQVGYHSTKNFYRALRQLTGMTPTEIRELRDDGAESVLTKLRLPDPRLTEQRALLQRGHGGGA